MKRNEGQAEEIVPQTEGWTECDSGSKEGRPRDEEKAARRRATNDRKTLRKWARDHTKTNRNEEKEINCKHDSSWFPFWESVCTYPSTSFMLPWCWRLSTYRMDMEMTLQNKTEMMQNECGTETFNTLVWMKWCCVSPEGHDDDQGQDGSLHEPVTQTALLRNGPLQKHTSQQSGH